MSAQPNPNPNLPVKQPNFQPMEPLGSLMKEIKQTFDSPQFDDIKQVFPFSTSSKAPLSHLTKGVNFKRADRIQLILWLQSHTPSEITPELMNVYYELKKEFAVNWESAQDGTVLRVATQSLHVHESSQRYTEDMMGGNKPGLVSRMLGRGRG